MSDVLAPAEARWIGSPHPFDLQEVYLCFRRTFDCPDASAALSVTADSRYRLWVNGRFVARGPARCWPHAQAVDTLDLTPFLRPGANVLAAQVYQPGYSHFAYVHRGAAGLLAWLTVGAGVMLVTDEQWRARRDPSFASAVMRVSIYGSGVEDRDLRLDDEWQMPDYDDSGWVTARLVAPPTGYPWTNLMPRPVPLLVESQLPLIPLAACTGIAYRNADPHADLVAGWTSATPQPLPAEDDRLTVRQGDDDAAFLLFDLGRDYLCGGWLEITGAAGGETILLSYAETIRDGRLVLPDPSTYCRLRPTDRFALRPGDQRVESFALRGGRYLLFAIMGRADLRVRFGATTAEYPLSVERRLVADDPTLQGVIALCEATFHACLHDSFVDGVWRESSQWLGDALPQALVMASLSDDTRPLRQVIETAAQGAYPDGVLPSVLPGEAHAYAVLDYNFTWVELLALYHRLTGDLVFARAHLPTLSALLDRFHADLAADGLLRSQTGRRLFLDWSAQSRNEPSAVYNLRCLLALQTAVTLAIDFGEGDRAAAWQGRATALREAVRRAFWRDGRWYDDPDGSTYSQLATALAVLTGSAAESERPGLLDALAACSLDPDDNPKPGRMVPASPFMHHYVLEALRVNGRADAALAVIRLRWGRWVESGQPTAWENWAVDFPDASRSHAFSAHPRYHLQQIALVHPELGVREVHGDYDHA